ncbi:MAG: type II toxin-antitoxin system HicA family toxin [Methylovulum sp.]|uniref:type II toxin-antitoxin system HicA family toxin n=1 Tax=Methylovulum sp. TaxID=1916980 RepID=UPI00261950C9|nr:type II toxin-antitoxin system HicA family toxin [Methylovulum sp.]MDD2723487.1 type II toxin-antitoxin system HicA family toxin [Methylovulum sp.]MDD5124529.1 type II toxin-antitoxin system HicA family toxin [Methylovulum sp.]
MKLPRDISGLESANKLAVLGYGITRQNGSHIRLTTQQKGEHHITVPQHDPLKVGTFSAILSDVAKHFSISREDLIKWLF